MAKMLKSVTQKDIFDFGGESSVAEFAWVRENVRNEMSASELGMPNVESGKYSFLAKK